VHYPYYAPKTLFLSADPIRGMEWPVVIVLVLLVGYIVSETIGSALKEGFVAPLRTDIGLSVDGWAEESGYDRDLRYSEAFVDIQGRGVASDFCRAVARKSDPDTLHISCALGQRDGMNTMEYNSRTKREGFRFSRDDYWSGSKYCRILKDETGEWFSGCAVAGASGFKAREERDTNPPIQIQQLLEAYEDILAWFRWQDDRDDYAQNAAFSVHGSPKWSLTLKPELTRGLQLNRWPLASQEAGEPAPPLRDYLRWGETGTLELHQAIQPRQVRAIACWIWWDAIEKHATIVECKNPNKSVSVSEPAGVSVSGPARVGKMDRIALGVDGGGHDLPALRQAKPAQELRPELIQSLGQITEPASLIKKPISQSATYFFEIWDKEHRLMRLDAPMGSAKTGEWQHVAVTTTDATAWWPTWQIWINGVLVGERVDGRMSPAMELRENYIGENVRGCIQDFRMYSGPLTPAKLASAIAWGKPKLHPLP